MRNLVAAMASVAALLPPFAVANDSAASVGLGGVRPAIERRVSMRKERLRIRLVEVKPTTPGAEPELRPVVQVEYEFLNSGPGDVATEVAFPVPPFDCPGPTSEWTGNLDGFRVWLDDRPVAFQKSVRATLEGRDVTDLLSSLGMGIDDFGGYSYEDEGKGFRERWGEERVAALVRENVLSPAEDGSWPLWTAQVTYHWPMRFPAGRVVRVRHEYTPWFGYSLTPVQELPKDGCFDAATVQNVRRRISRNERSPNLSLTWVDYILTTANTWKTPIEDFELLVERPVGHSVSFCWDGKVTKASATSFRAEVKGFVPTRELRVYFF